MGLSLKLNFQFQFAFEYRGITTCKLLTTKTSECMEMEAFLERGRTVFGRMPQWPSGLKTNAPSCSLPRILCRTAVNIYTQPPWIWQGKECDTMLVSGKFNQVGTGKHHTALTCLSVYIVVSVATGKREIFQKSTKWRWKLASAQSTETRNWNGFLLHTESDQLHDGVSGNSASVKNNTSLSFLRELRSDAQSVLARVSRVEPGLGELLIPDSLCKSGSGGSRGTPWGIALSLLIVFWHYDLARINVRS